VSDYTSFHLNVEFFSRFDLIPDLPTVQRDEPPTPSIHCSLLQIFQCNGAHAPAQNKAGSASAFNTAAPITVTGDSEVKFFDLFKVKFSNTDGHKNIKINI